MLKSATAEFYKNILTKLTEIFQGVSIKSVSAKCVKFYGNILEKKSKRVVFTAPQKDSIFSLGGKMLDTQNGELTGVGVKMGFELEVGEGGAVGMTIGIFVG